MKNKDEQAVNSKRELPVVTSEIVNMDFPARISSQLFTYGKFRWKMGVRPFRLLMMVTQTLAMEKKPYPELFPEYTFPLQKVFEFMGVSNNNKRYDLLVKDMKELMSAVIEEKTVSKRGKIKWTGKTLISWCEVNEETSSLSIQINEKSREYLVGMQRWAELQPRIYLKLSTENQNWFYSFFQKEIYVAKKTGKSIKLIVDIQNLKEQLFLDNVKTYNPEEYSKANEKFFSRIIGITKPKGWKYNKENDSLNTPWDYVSETGKTTGTLYNITSKTDINAAAYPIKEGAKYKKICFILSYKEEYLTKTEEYRYAKKIESENIYDMGKPETTGRSKSNNPHQLMRDLFDNPPIIDGIENPVYNNDIPKGYVIIPAETINSFVDDYNKKNYPETTTPEKIATSLGYKILPDGRALKIHQPLSRPNNEK